MSKKNISQILTNSLSNPPPIWMMRQAGRYLPEYRKLRQKESDFLSFCTTPHLSVEASLQPMRRYAFDAAILFSDILLVPYAMGLSVSFEEGRGPLLSSIDRTFKFPKEERVLEKLKIVAETLVLLRNELDKENFSDSGMIGFCGAPWTLAAYMLEGESSRDFFKMRYFALSNPSFFSDLIAYLTSLLSKFLSMQFAAGVDFVQIFDSWAGLTDEEQFSRWVIAPTKEIVENLPHCPVFGFARQAGSRVFSYGKETGLKGISLDSGQDLQMADKLLPQEIIIQGNLDPMRLLVGGIELEKEIKRICNQFRDRSFIFNLGHGILKETPPENVAQAVSLVRNFR